MLSHSLVFIHGWGTSPWVWEKQVEYFSMRYKVETPNSNLVSTINSQLSHVLIGWSYGGMRAIQMAAARPGDYKALVLVGCSARFSEGLKPALIKNLIRNLKRDFEATMRNCYGQFFSNNETVFIGELVNKQTIPDKKLTIQILEELAIMDLREILAEIKIPVLIVHGDKDAICPLGSGIYLHKNIKGSRIEIFKGTGHMPFYTRPVEFNKILEGFIDDIK